MAYSNAGGAMSVTAAARYIGVGRTTLYRLVAEGRLPTRKLGRRTLLLRADLDRLLAALPSAMDASDTTTAPTARAFKEAGR